MSLLVFDVLYDAIQLRNTRTEGSIFGLPREQTLVGKRVSCTHFEEPPLIRCMALPIDGRRHRQQQVNMLFHAANAQGFHLLFAGAATKKWPESVPKLRRQGLRSFVLNTQSEYELTYDLRDLCHLGLEPGSELPGYSQSPFGRGRREMSKLQPPALPRGLASLTVPGIIVPLTLKFASFPLTPALSPRPPGEGERQHGACKFGRCGCSPRFFVFRFGGTRRPSSVVLPKQGRMFLPLQGGQGERVGVRENRTLAVLAACALDSAPENCPKVPIALSHLSFQVSGFAGGR
jgi:hypothetical protein